MTPGDINTGTAVQSSLVSLLSVTPNAPVGTVTVTFNGDISQVLAGDGSIAAATGSGISITDTNGVPIPIIDSRPVITGIGTSTLTLSFTGSGVVGGQLPAGSYQLNFVGNGFVANGRAVDVANDGTQVNGFREFEFTVSPGLPGDHNRITRLTSLTLSCGQSLERPLTVTRRGVPISAAPPAAAGLWKAAAAKRRQLHPCQLWQVLRARLRM
jgi:hypothetical protein